MDQPPAVQRFTLLDKASDWYGQRLELIAAGATFQGPLARTAATIELRAERQSNLAA